MCKNVTPSPARVIGIFGKSGMKYDRIFQHITVSGIAMPIQNAGRPTRGGHIFLLSSRTSSSATCAAGKGSFSCSDHCRRKITAMHKQVQMIAPANANHQNRGTIQTSHGIAWPGGRPSKKRRMAPFSSVGNNQCGKWGWRNSDHRFWAEAK